MFEYHEPNLTVGHDDIAITVALTKSVDIEKPLVDIDLEGAQAIAASQRVIKAEHLMASKLHPQVYSEINALEQEIPGKNYLTDKHFLLGYAPVDDYGSAIYGGDGNGEVLLRAHPYLRIGYRGLLAFCSNERKLLLEEVERLHKDPSFWHFHSLQLDNREC